ncbi:MAG: O-antigen ligase family protein [Rhabdochlamydiaceae bacterium]|nr:O-antigen ligase family protein [Rhabdochlamydiaceae bacterium]
MLIASFFSPMFYRSFVYCLVYIFNFCVYFLVPISMIYFGDEFKILKLYYISFLCIGSYAFLQFFASLFGVILPFVLQQLVVARGQALAHEPSFFALYAIPFVVFFTAFTLFSSCYRKVRSSSWLVLIFSNLCLLVSTSTTAVFSYIVTFAVLFVFSSFTWVKKWIRGVKKRLLIIFFGFASLFSFGAFIFKDLFHETFFKFFYYGFLTHVSFADRYQGMLNSMTVFLENPLFGVGLGGVAPYLYQKQLYEGMAGMLVDVDRYSIEKLEPTNILTEILASLGIYGLIGFAVLVLVIWSHFKRTLQNPKLAQEERATLLAFLISIVVLLICLQINMGLFRVYTWVHIGIGMGYVLKVKGRLKEV